jgi:hypothetical protein
LNSRSFAAGTRADAERDPRVREEDVDARGLRLVRFFLAAPAQVFFLCQARPLVVRKLRPQLHSYLAMIRAPGVGGVVSRPWWCFAQDPGRTSRLCPRQPLRCRPHASLSVVLASRMPRDFAHASRWSGRTQRSSTCPISCRMMASARVMSACRIFGAKAKWHAGPPLWNVTP